LSALLAGYTVAALKEKLYIETIQEVLFTDGSKRTISSVSPDPSSSSSSLPELPEQLCGALELGFLNSSSSSPRRLFARQESEKDLGRSLSLEWRRDVKEDKLELRSTTDLLRSLISGLDQLLRRDLEEI